MEKSVLDRRLEQMAAEGTRFRPGTDVGGTGEGALSGQQLRRPLRRRRAGHRRRPWRATCRSRAASWPACMQAMEYLPPANRVALGEEPLPDQPPIDAEGQDVVIIGGGDTGADCLGTATRQGARSVTQLEIMPRPAEERPQSHPWPTYPMIYRVSSAHEEGGERVYAVSTTELVDDGTRRRSRRCGSTRSRWSTAGSSRSRARSASCPPSWCSSRWASPARSAAAWSSSSASSSTSAATSAATATTCPRAPASSSPATPAAASRSSSGRSPRAGPRRRGRTPPHRHDQPAGADPAHGPPAHRVTRVTR